jgi:Flp pilus assembly protein TadG
MKYRQNSKRTAIRKAIRRFGAGDDGVALVEFTIFAPLLVIMSIYTMDFGLLFFNNIGMQNAAQAGVQWAIANRIYNSAQIQVAAKNAVNLYSPINFTTINVCSKQFCGCSEDSSGNPTVTSLNANVPCNNITACTASSTCTKGIVGTYVTVTVTTPHPYTPLAPFGLIASIYNLSATSTGRIQ